MSETLLYLSRADVARLAIPPAEVREAVLKTFADHGAGRTQSLPKASLPLGPGRMVQAMVAASQAARVTVLKWVAVAPVAPASALRGVNGLICVNDHDSGVPLAVLDGDEITLLRTAAMSAAAASRMVSGSPRSIGFVGCGLQAQAHLDAFLDLYPGLQTALAFSRSAASADRLAEAARARGLSAEVTGDADALLARSDLVISMVPAAAGLAPFLDAGLMKPDAFASAVDIGRSWRPETLGNFALRATDSLEQSKAPYDVENRPVASAPFHTDLVALAAAPPAPPAAGRRLFCFRGFALADLALAALVVQRARDGGIGTVLPR